MIFRLSIEDFAVLRAERVLENAYCVAIGDKFVLDRRVQPLAERFRFISTEETIAEWEVALARAAVLGELPDRSRSSAGARALQV